MTDAFSVDHRSPHLSEPVKILPILFVVFIIVTLWGIYTTYHCIPLLQEDYTFQQGILHTAVFNICAAMLVYCYGCCVFVLPGSMPDTADWEYVPLDQQTAEALGQLESKRSGDRRHCKWCNKYKPDRCHHCRVCRRCVLRMDHHCPWIYNCVGFLNHKFFVLLLLYSAIATHIITWTMYWTLKAAIVPETPFFNLFFLLFGETLAVLMTTLTTCFFVFHVWLMLKAMTTIEFCEKSMKRTASDPSVFCRGNYGNTRAVLGDNPWLWLLPASLPSGDGLGFITDETSPLITLSKDMEAGHGRRKIKQWGASRSSRRNPGAGTGECADSDVSNSHESDVGSEQSPAAAQLLTKNSSYVAAGGSSRMMP